MDSTRCLPWIVFTLCFILCASADATDRFYQDQTCLSPDGRLKLEAKSPENAAGKPGRFAKDFEYTLHEVESKKVLWKRKQPGHEGSPVSIYIHNDGWVVILAGGYDLVLINPQGVKLTEIPILRNAIPDKEVAEFVHESTAGSFWSGCSCHYFFEIAGSPYFGIRTAWGRRILLSFNKAQLVIDEGELQKAAMNAERAFVVNTLQLAADRVAQRGPKSPQQYGDYFGKVWKDIEDLDGAIYLAGKMEIKEAKHWLGIMEQIPSFGSVGGRYYGPENEIFLEESEWDRTRQLIQLSIRRLGGIPTGYPVRRMLIHIKGAKLPDKLYSPPLHQAPRSVRAEEVKTDFKVKDVVDKIGAPDFIVYFPKPGTDDKEWANFQGPYWDYDIDAIPPYTLRIHWKDRLVQKLEKIQPPAWKEGRLRDKELAH